MQRGFSQPPLSSCTLAASQRQELQLTATTTAAAAATATAPALQERAAAAHAGVGAAERAQQRCVRRVVLGRPHCHRLSRRRRLCSSRLL